MNAMMRDEEQIRVLVARLFVNPVKAHQGHEGTNEGSHEADEDEGPDTGPQTQTQTKAQKQY
jgi:hypothetical protein